MGEEEVKIKVFNASENVIVTRMAEALFYVLCDCDYCYCGDKKENVRLAKTINKIYISNTYYVKVLLLPPPPSRL